MHIQSAIICIVTSFFFGWLCSFIFVPTLGFIGFFLCLIIALNHFAPVIRAWWYNTQQNLF